MFFYLTLKNVWCETLATLILTNKVYMYIRKCFMNIDVYVLYMSKKNMQVCNKENSELMSRSNSGYGISVSFVRQCLEYVITSHNETKTADCVKTIMLIDRN